MSFKPKGRLAAILERRVALGPDAFVFGSQTGAYWAVEISVIEVH